MIGTVVSKSKNYVVLSVAGDAECVLAYARAFAKVEEFNSLEENDLCEIAPPVMSGVEIKTSRARKVVPS